MALEKMEALEDRIRGLVRLIQELKIHNLKLEQELTGTKERLFQQEECSRQWAQERSDIRSRVEKVLAELEYFEVLDGFQNSKEVALD